MYCFLGSLHTEAIVANPSASSWPHDWGSLSLGCISSILACAWSPQVLSVVELLELKLYGMATKSTSLTPWIKFYWNFMEWQQRCTCNGPKSFLLLDNRISSTPNVFPEILCFVQWLQIVLFLCAMGRPTYLDLFSLQILLHLEFLPWYSGVIIFWKPYVNL
jgi:hypothetical protein